MGALVCLPNKSGEIRDAKQCPASLLFVPAFGHEGSGGSRSSNDRVTSTMRQAATIDREIGPNVTKRQRVAARWHLSDPPEKQLNGPEATIQSLWQPIG